MQPGSVIKVTFNENVKMGTGFIELKTSNGTSVDIIKGINGKVLTINHPTKLAYGTRYTLYLHKGCVIDLAGNPIASSSSSFTTLKRGLVPSNIIANTATMRSSAGKPLYHLPYVVTNYGKSKVSSSVAKIYLTPSKSISGTKYYLAKQTISNLSPGKYIKLNTPYVIPSNVPLNSYYVAVVVDGSVEYSFIKTKIIPFNPNY
ncbi:MAG TPA: Ig-like domain-containing protein [Methanobacterium sp.]|nr:Ig-like domain-containing protein [Methanobacterium sp.]